MQLNFFGQSFSNSFLKYGDRWSVLFKDADPVLIDKFLKYHRENSHLLEMFMKFALEALGSGRKRFSIWMIANRARWYSNIETSGKDFKISNDFLACYSRMIIFIDPRFEGFFQLKQMKSIRGVPRD